MYVLLTLLAVFGPMVVAFFVVIRGWVRHWARLPWLVGWGYCLIPACYLSFQDVCRHVSGTCPVPAQLDEAQKARVALVTLALGLIVLGVSRAVSSVGAKAVCGVLFAVLVAFSEVWMWLRLKDAGLSGAGLLCLALLAWAVLAEGLAYRAARRAALEAQADEAEAYALDDGAGPTPA